MPWTFMQKNIPESQEDPEKCLPWQSPEYTIETDQGEWFVLDTEMNEIQKNTEVSLILKPVAFASSRIPEIKVFPENCRIPILIFPQARCFSAGRWGQRCRQRIRDRRWSDGEFHKTALICGIFVILGAVVSGAGAAQTLGKLGSINAIGGSFMAALYRSDGYWMTRLGLPVSTTQAIIGSIMGWNFSAILTPTSIVIQNLSTWTSAQSYQQSLRR